MPSLLGPTNPVPGYDNTSNAARVTTPPASDTSIRNIVNPQQVVRPDGRTDRQDQGDATQSFATRYESNFMLFLQRLRASPELAGEFVKLMGGGLRVTSGLSAGFAQELGELLQFLKMDETQLLAFLQNQMKGGARFGGALFQMLRDAYGGTQSEMLKSDILQFLRRFSDYSSTGHLEEKLVRTLGEMSQSLPSKWADRLTDILGRLENGVASGDRAGNLKLLQGELFPLISQYVRQTHDHGRARQLLSMLALDVTRYENGSPQGLLQSLRHLSANGVLPQELAEKGDGELMRLLRNTDFFQAARSDAFADRLADLTNVALKGQAGVAAQETFQNILSAMLINESVFMPLTHIMLPLDWNGRLMFSEMWVDPDAEQDTRGSAESPTTRLLIKMDIEELGAFDVLLNVKDSEVALHVACPPGVAAYDRQISDALGGILSRNGLTPTAVRVAAMDRPMAISQAFPKLFERVNGVNVKA